MIDKVLNLQISLFGSFIDIKLKTEIVINLLNALKEYGFVPGSADVASIDIKTGKMTVDSRMQMLSPDKTWVIAFFTERIDFNYCYQPETSKYKCIDELLVFANQLVEKVFSVFNATTGNRLALNCRLALENMSADDLKQFCGRFTNPLSAYKGDSYAEWGVRFNSRGKFKVSESEEEECNRITEMMQTENPVTTETQNCTHDVVLTMDINTLVSNLNKRFRYGNLICFANDAAKFISEVTKEIEEGC